jgi:hypothetical protein
MDVTFDRHLFTQIGLDSGSLTMLGTLVHGFTEPGEYRCALHAGPDVKAVFIVHADPESSNAHATVDLAALAGGAPPTDAGECGCEGSPEKAAAIPRFVVNPRGHVVFRVGSGGGQFYVHARRTASPAEDKGYDTRAMADGDTFAAILLRPGTYAMTNTLAKAKGEIVVDYPPLKERHYRPGEPVRVTCDARGFSPASLRVGPGQGVIVESSTPSRIAITLSKADDGPADRVRPRPPRRFAGLQPARRARG